MARRFSFGGAWCGMPNRLAPSLALLLACLAPVSCAQAQTAPAASAAAAPLPDGTTTFIFADWAGPAIPVYAFVPEGLDPATAPILIVMHGQGRDADRYVAQWSGPAASCGFITIVPEFSRSQFPTSREYNFGNITARDGNGLRPRNEWTFSAIEPLFDHVLARIGGRQTGYTIYGHSAGSQFVHRFALTQRDTRAARFLAANAGWYSLPTFAQDYPFGLKGTDLTEADAERALGLDMVLLLGDRDIDPNEDSLNRSEGAMQQGEHRFARGHNFHAFGKALAQERGWRFGWSVREVPGVAHDNGGIAQAAGDLVAGVTACAAR
jgi:poly(3-hydroxybutyrate) depolymerase